MTTGVPGYLIVKMSQFSKRIGAVFVLVVCLAPAAFIAALPAIIVMRLINETLADAFFDSPAAVLSTGYVTLFCGRLVSRLWKRKRAIDQPTHGENRNISSMRNKRRKQYRQGDIFIEEVHEVPVDAKRQTRVRRLVVATGEATGHQHVLSPKKEAMDWWRNDAGDIYVRGAEVGRLVHEEHDAIEILTDAPFILCRRQLEFTPDWVVHQDDFGTLYRYFLHGRDLLMVKVVNSTPEPDGSFKDYFLSVHPELRPLPPPGTNAAEWFATHPPQALTARNAVASTFSMTGEEYSPDLET